MRSKPQIDARAPFTLILLLVTLSFLVRLWPALQPAVWFDEIFSIYYVQKDLSAIWGPDWRLDPTPPLYYTLLHFWVLALGTSEWVLRFLSLAFSSATAWLIFLIGQELRDRSAGVFAAIIWAFVPLSVDYGVEIRAYALEGIFIAFAILQFSKILHLFDYQEPQSMDTIWTAAALLVLSAILLTYTHITAIFPYGAIALFVGIFALRREPRFLLPWVGLNLLYLVAMIPQIIASIAVIKGNAPTLAWLQPPSLSGLWGIFAPLMTGDPGSKMIAHGLAALWLVLVVGSLWSLRRDNRSLIVLAYAPLIAIIGFVIFSRFQPALLTRTVVWSVIPLVVLVGAGLSSFMSARYGRLISGAVILVIAASCVLHLQQRALARGDAAGLEHLAREVNASGRLVLLDGEFGCEFAYYQPQLMKQVYLADIGTDREFFRTQRVELGCNSLPSITREQILEAAVAGDHVWLVGRTPFYGNGARIRRDLGRLQDSLAPALQVTKTIENASFIAVRLTGQQKTVSDGPGEAPINGFGDGALREKSGK